MLAWDGAIGGWDGAIGGWDSAIGGLGWCLIEYGVEVCSVCSVQFVVAMAREGREERSDNRRRLLGISLVLFQHRHNI